MILFLMLISVKMEVINIIFDENSNENKFE